MFNSSLRKRPTFGDATTGFVATWHLRNERRNSILMKRHYTDLGSAPDWLCCMGNLIQPVRSTTLIWVIWETTGSIAKCQLFSQASLTVVIKKIWLGIGQGFVCKNKYWYKEGCSKSTAGEQAHLWSSWVHLLLRNLHFNKGFHSDVHSSDMFDWEFFWQFFFVRHSPGDFRKSPYLGVSVCFFYWRPIKTRCFENVTGLSSAPGPCLFLWYQLKNTEEDREFFRQNFLGWLSLFLATLRESK